MEKAPKALVAAVESIDAVAEKLAPPKKQGSLRDRIIAEAKKVRAIIASGRA